MSICVSALLLVTFFALPANQPQAYAIYGDGGSSEEHSSPYVGMIDWVDWSQPATEKDASYLEATGTNERGTVNWNRQDAGTLRSKDINTAEGYQVRSKTPMGDSTIETTCTLKNFYEDNQSYKALANAWLNVHIPGAYPKDGWDDVYHSYDKDKKQGIPAGIGRTANSRARLDVSCVAQLRRPKVGSTEEELVDLPIKGLVFADAESMSTEEYTEITPAKIDSNKPVSWYLLEQHSAAGEQNDTHIKVGKSNNDLYKHSGLKDRLDINNALKFNYPHNESRADFSQVTTYYADNTNGAYIDFRGRPGNVWWDHGIQYIGNYVAIGVVIGADLADGPLSYGQAGAIVEPPISGVPLTGSTKAREWPTADVVEGGAPYLGAHGPDLDTQFIRDKTGASKAQWNPLNGDDRKNSTSSKDSFNDEDAIDKPLLVTAQPGEVEQIISCVPADTKTTVSGWLDWNADGIFDDSERANAECLPLVAGEKQSIATLRWNVRADMLPDATKPNPAPSLLRLIATTQAPETFTFNSLVIGGEVEDHAVTLVSPKLDLIKQIVGTDGQINAAGVISGFSFTAAGQELDIPAEPQVTTEAGKVSWSVPFAEFSHKVRSLDGANEPAVNVTVTEKPASGYLPYSVPTCTTVTKADWVSQDFNGKSEQVYAWPAEQSYEPVLANGAFTLPVTPTAITSCAIQNQPYGQISVTSDIARGELENGIEPDASLRFSGTYTCTAPRTGPFAGSQPVNGHWGPIAVGEKWTSDPGKDHIIAGSSCTVKQDPQLSPPVAGNAQYIWKDAVDYQVINAVGATITANAGVLNEQLGEVVATNTIERVKNTELRWTKVDESNQLLTGAVFELRATDDSGNSISHIADCTNDPCASGSDQDSSVGAYKLTDIALGNYQLIETQAPTGFEKLDAPVNFDIQPADLATGKDLGKIENKRVTASLLPSLPMSGGMSTILFTGFGFSVVCLATILGIGALRNRRGN